MPLIESYKAANLSLKSSLKIQQKKFKANVSQIIPFLDKTLLLPIHLFLKVAKRSFL